MALVRRPARAELRAPQVERPPPEVEPDFPLEAGQMAREPARAAARRAWQEPTVAQKKPELELDWRLIATAHE